MDDLILKLRSQIGDDVQKSYSHEALFRRAARIKKLEAENAELRSALKDALDEILTLYAWSDQVGLYDIEEKPAVVKARAALAETEDKTND